MEIVIGNKGSGKTTLLIEKSSQDGFYIVCRDRKTAYLIARMSDDIGLPIPFPLTYNEFLERQYSRKIPGFLFDDLDFFVQFLSMVPVVVSTLSDDDNVTEI